MDWKDLLEEDDCRFFRENISLLEEQVHHRLPHAREAAGVLSALRCVPRHFFVHPEYKTLAYSDNAFPTWNGQTTAAPSVIALMIHLAGIRSGSRVLEIGTGTGYQAAVLAEMGASVFTVELDPFLARRAAGILEELGYRRPGIAGQKPCDKDALRLYSRIHREFPHRGDIRLFTGNGREGLPEIGPFSSIIVAAAAANIEELAPLADQLAPGGRMAAPVGGGEFQSLKVFFREGKRLHLLEEEATSVSFVRLR